jgi:hypothetical protein
MGVSPLPLRSSLEEQAHPALGANVEVPDPAIQLVND